MRRHSFARLIENGIELPSRTLSSVASSRVLASGYPVAQCPLSCPVQAVLVVAGASTACCCNQSVYVS